MAIFGSWRALFNTHSPKYFLTDINILYKHCKRNSLVCKTSCWKCLGTLFLGLVTLSDSPKFPEGIEKAIRQCLRQLALLQTVWQHILPVNIYCKAIGKLTSIFVIFHCCFISYSYFIYTKYSCPKLISYW